MARREMPTLKSNERIKTFEEVNLGFTLEDVISEANRCIGCKNANCVRDCPISNNIPAVINCIKNGHFNEASAILNPTLNLSSICSRVCPQEVHCEKNCIAGLINDKEPVAIGSILRYITDNYPNIETQSSIRRREKVAIVGSGPSGLACAISLLKKGFRVTVYEALHKIGGVLVYGIPSFRLPRSVIEETIRSIRSLGGKFVTNAVIGKTIEISELFEEHGFAAVYIATGAGLPKFMGIPGENYNGVYSANEFLTRINLMGANRAHTDTPITDNKTIAIVGGGNVALDAARCAIRLGAEKVYIIYRRSRDEMPARHEEIVHAEEEGIIFMNLTNPTEFVGDEEYKVVGMRCVRMQLGELDSSNRRSVSVIRDSEFYLPVDLVIQALGTTVNPLLIQSNKNLLTNNKGCIAIDEKQLTSIDGVFAGGDATNGASTVIGAVSAGQNAASSIEEYIDDKTSN